MNLLEVIYEAIERGQQLQGHRLEYFVRRAVANFITDKFMHHINNSKTCACPELVELLVKIIE